jgi:hypothetical protein
MSYIEVIGTIWMPAVTAAYRYSLSGYDIDNMRSPDDGKIARREIQGWLDTHAGDFQSVEDFYAEIDGACYGWKNPESECVFINCMYPSEED